MVLRYFHEVYTICDGAYKNIILLTIQYPKIVCIKCN